ncbi:MAG: histidine kinase N-terminal 7TM domain-containing protein [Chloroflexota bacterium]
MSPDIIAAILDFGNLILSSVNVIIGFSLFIYLVAYNRTSPVAQAFCALTAFVTIVYLVDVSIAEVDMERAAGAWLRLQWVGIALVPAAYLHFSDALLRTTGSASRPRRAAVLLAYLVGLATLALVATGHWIVDGVVQKNHFYHLVAGPGFGLFVAFYVLTSLGGWIGVSLARHRSVTSTSRRRMTYLMLAVVAPSLAVFPYLLIPTAARSLPVLLVSLLTLVGNLAIALMTVLIGYIVAYQGVLLPDRVVKHRLLHFLMRGPLVAILVVVIMLAVPHVEPIMGLPRDTVLVVAVAGSVVILQLLINISKPAFDRVIYRGDRKEISWIQSLDQRLLTTLDLEQLLENTLIAICDLLRSPGGFVVTMHDAQPALRVFCGARETAQTFLAHTSAFSLLERLSESRRDEFISNEDWVTADGHLVLPLRGRSDERPLGILGIQRVDGEPQFGDAQIEAVFGLVRQAELALEDMQLQQQVFAVLQDMSRELDRVQLLRSRSGMGGRQALHDLEANPIAAPGFMQTVKDALMQYWGGPKLSQSPLLNLNIVRQRLSAHDDVPAKAVRAVLLDAIGRLRPSSERSLTSNEWTVFNILDLRFVQGQRIRDVARQLAMSESDYYRKQRVAIEQIAAVLAQMERATLDQTPPS